jgi:predicted nucleic acid-binding protein
MPVSVVDASAVGALFPALDVKLLAVPPTAAVQIALKRRLTAYDASYLWLAAELGASLLTLDAALTRAWKRHRVLRGE